MTVQLAEVGQFCPNDECEFYQDLKNASIIFFSIAQLHPLVFPLSARQDRGYNWPNE